MIILQALWFILPSYVANMMPVLADKLHLPFGNAINKSLFGANKTWRGFYTGYIGALIMLYIQQYLQVNGVLIDRALIDYTKINIFFYAFLFGIGALSGDLLKSYIKRRFGIKSGKPWFPFDQLDFIVGTLIFVYPFYQLDWIYIILILILTPGLHILTNKISYFIGRKKVPR